jgi:ParB/RepB/Spo0J family partition protein
LPRPILTRTARDRRAKAVVAKKFNKLERLSVTYVPTDAIKPNSYNPNRQSPEDFELLLRSIEEDGFTSVITVQEGVNEIVDGEHRWRAAQALGLTEIPVVFVDMTTAQRMVSTLRMNRARGNEDVELSAQVLRDLQAIGALDHAQDSLALSDAEINLLITNVAAPELLAGDDFTDAWVPFKTEDDHAIDGQSDTSLTDRGAQALRSRQAALASAVTEQERRQAREDNQVFRVSMVFDGDEAEIVRAILGHRPAIAVLALCKAELERPRLATDSLT